MPGSPEKYPWNALKTTYIEGWTLADGTVHWPSFSEMMERVYPEGRVDHVRRRAGRERWLDHRKEFQAEMARQRQIARAKELAEATERVDTRALRSAETGLAVVHARLSEMARDAQARLADATLRARVGESSEASTLALAAYRFHVVAMRALGLERPRAGNLQPEAEAGEWEGINATKAERSLAERVQAYVDSIAAGEVTSMVAPQLALPPDA